MIARIASISLALVAALVLVDSVSAKDKKKAEHGAVVSVTDSQLVVNQKASKEDKTGAEKTYPVADNVSVVIDNNPAKVSDLKAGDHIAFTLNDEGKVATIHKGDKKKKSA